MKLDKVYLVRSPKWNNRKEYLNATGPKN